MPNLDLDVSTPEEFPAVLRRAAEHFFFTQGELQSAWQDKQAGRVWARFARILDRAADSADKALAEAY